MVFHEQVPVYHEIVKHDHLTPVLVGGFSVIAASVIYSARHRDHHSVTVYQCPPRKPDDNCPEKK